MNKIQIILRIFVILVFQPSTLFSRFNVLPLPFCSFLLAIPSNVQAEIAVRWQQTRREQVQTRTSENQRAATHLKLPIQQLDLNQHFIDRKTTLQIVCLHNSWSFEQGIHKKGLKKKNSLLLQLRNSISISQIVDESNRNIHDKQVTVSFIYNKETSRNWNWMSSLTISKSVIKARKCNKCKNF